MFVRLFDLCSTSIVCVVWFDPYAKYNDADVAFLLHCRLVVHNNVYKTNINPICTICTNERVYVCREQHAIIT